MSIVLDGSNGITTNSGTVVSTTDATLNGLTVGKGGGSVSTNTAVGASALAANTTGANNTGNGMSALVSNTTGSRNSAIGRSALGSNDVGADNSALGYFALQNNTSGTSNTALGVSALQSNTTASNNTAVGYQAGYSNTTGASGTFLGVQAGYSVTTGNNNVLLGYSAGQYIYSITTGGQNVCVGTNSNPSSATSSYEIVIGTLNTIGKGSSTGFIYPNGGGVYQGNNSSSWSTTSDQRLKKNIVDNTEGLDKITQIRVRNFEYRTAEEVTELPAHTVIDKQGIQLGVIAQELQQVCPDCVKEESTGVLSVDSDNVFWHMVNAIKDLKALVDAQATEIAELKAKVA